MTVYGGTQKLTFGLGGNDSDYMAKRNAAMAQAAFLDLGVQAVAEAGTGATYLKSQRNPYYGNVNDTEGDVSRGENSNFTAESDTFNAPLANSDNQTGSLLNATSSTNDPQIDPENLDESALAARIRKMSENGSINLNPSSVFNI